MWRESRRCLALALGCTAVARVGGSMSSICNSLLLHLSSGVHVVVCVLLFFWVGGVQFLHCFPHLVIQF